MHAIPPLFNSASEVRRVEWTEGMNTNSIAAQMRQLARAVVENNQKAVALPISTIEKPNRERDEYERLAREAYDKLVALATKETGVKGGDPKRIALQEIAAC